MADASILPMLEEFRGSLPLYDRYAASVESLLRNILHASGMIVHSVSVRVKDPDHLAEKIQRPGKAYRELLDVTDLVGARIITYFADDIDRVAAVIEREFQVDASKSVDKRNASTPDRFGYRSLHKICGFRDERCALIEYAAFQKLVFELQIRSILEHAWAEIEHDLGYKSPRGIPDNLRRRFSKLAALLELADDEFQRLRGDLAQYAVDVVEEIRERPESTPINAVTLQTYAGGDESYGVLLQRITGLLGAPATGSDPSRWEDRAEELDYLGVATIDALRHIVQAKGDTIIRFVETFIDREVVSKWYPWLPLYYLAQVLIGERPTVEESLTALEDLRIADPDERSAYAEELQSFARDERAA